MVSVRRVLNRWYLGVQIVVAALISTACVSRHQPFPANWVAPARIAGGRCPAIAGDYVNEEEEAKGKAINRLILRWFRSAGNIPWPKEKWIDVSRVSIRQPIEDIIEITGLSAADDRLVSASLSKLAGDFTCNDGWVQVKTSNLSAVSSAFVKTFETHSFAKADGYLVEMLEGEMFGMMLILPVGGSGTSWYKYAEIRVQGE